MRAAFMAGAIGNDIAQPLAEQIWEVLAGYTGFGFCKAHAASYAVVAYRMAYCKAHYPAELLAACSTIRRVLPGPGLHGGGAAAGAAAARARRQPQRGGDAWPASTRRLGLNAVKGLRGSTVRAVLAARRRGRPFRIAARPADAGAAEQGGDHALIAGGGARPSRGGARAAGVAVAGAAVVAAPWSGGGPAAPAPARPACRCPNRLPDLPADMPALRPYSPTERLDLEAVRRSGFTLSANPLTPYRDLLARYRAVPAGKLVAQPGRVVVVGGLPVVVRRHLTVKGEWMLFLTLQDLTDLIEVVVMPDSYTRRCRRWWPAGRLSCAGGWRSPFMGAWFSTPTACARSARRPPAKRRSPAIPEPAPPPEPVPVSEYADRA